MFEIVNGCRLGPLTDSSRYTHDVRLLFRTSHRQFSVHSRCVIPIEWVFAKNHLAFDNDFQL